MQEELHRAGLERHREDPVEDPQALRNALDVLRNREIPRFAGVRRLVILNRDAPQ